MGGGGGLGGGGGGAGGKKVKKTLDDVRRLYESSRRLEGVIVQHPVCFIYWLFSPNTLLKLSSSCEKLYVILVCFVQNLLQAVA